MSVDNYGAVRGDSGALTMRWLLLAIALFVGAAQSQEQTHAQASNDKKRATADQRGTRQSPLFIESLPTLKSNEQTAYEHYEHSEKPTLERLLTWATVFLAAVTGALAFFTYFLWGATRKLVRESGDTARKELRAYVALEDISFVPVFLSPVMENQTTYSDQLQIRIKNYGQTPSQETTVWFGYEPTGMPKNFAIDGPIAGRQMLHPDMSFNSNVFSPPVANNKFWFWGQIIYQDIYDRWWKTNFCYAHHGRNVFAPTGKRNNEQGPYKTEQEARDAPS